MFNLFNTRGFRTFLLSILIFYSLWFVLFTYGQIKNNHTDSIHKKEEESLPKAILFNISQQNKSSFHSVKKNYLINLNLGEVKLDDGISFLYPQIEGMLDKSFFEIGVESQIRFILIKLFKYHKHQTFLDIGMNNGYFTLMAAAMGQRVLSFDPQSLCHFLVEKAAIASGLSQNITLIQTALHYIPDLPIDFNEDSCDGGFETSNLISDDKTSLSTTMLTSTADMHIRDKKTTEFLNVKIDTEGFEINILKGLIATINGKEKSKIQNLIIEVAQHNWMKNQNTLSEGIDMLSLLSNLFENSIILYDDSNPFTTEHVIPMGQIFDLAILCPKSWSLIIHQKLGKGAMNIWFSNDEQIFSEWNCPKLVTLPHNSA